jgi:hypothetical protein
LRSTVFHNEEQKKLGPMTLDEKVVLMVANRLVLWSTDFFHHIDPAWIALGVAVGMAVPFIGEILTPEMWHGSQLSIVLFWSARWRSAMWAGQPVWRLVSRYTARQATAAFLSPG